jgi:hypothetical protein
VTKLYEVRPLADLPNRHKRFIKECAKTGDREVAYLAAGYKETRSLASRARKLEKDLRVHINQAVRARLQDTGRVINALNAVDDLVKDSSEPGAAVRLNAAKDVLAKAGLEEAPKAPVKSVLTDKELKDKIEEYTALVQLKVVDSE